MGSNLLFDFKRPPGQHTKRVSSAAVQGPDSYVVIYTGILRSKQKKRLQDTDPQVRFAFLNEYLAAAVVSWNWTGQDNKPLPLPRGNPDAIASLSIPEVQWLMKQVGMRG